MADPDLKSASAVGKEEKDSPLGLGPNSTTTKNNSEATSTAGAPPPTPAVSDSASAAAKGEEVQAAATTTPSLAVPADATATTAMPAGDKGQSEATTHSIPANSTPQASTVDGSTTTTSQPSPTQKGGAEALPPAPVVRAPSEESSGSAPPSTTAAVRVRSDEQPQQQAPPRPGVSAGTAPPALQNHVSGSSDDDGLDEFIKSPQGQNAIVERSPGGRYVRFMEKLGSGASKDVYRAYDTQEGIEVAWNLIGLSGLPKTDRNRIVKEVRLLESLHHENIISFHGSWVNRERQEVHFVTEILSSGTLKSFINKVQVIRWKIAKRWAVQILKGLDYLHSQDPPVIHRDLKCENIFINGTSGDLRIGDFGLSTQHGNGKAHSVLGTPEFMAPDLYEDNSYDQKVDIYAFGMCMLEIFTQEIPYKECKNPAQIYKKVSNGELPEILSRLRSKHARDFVMLCLGDKNDKGEYVRPSAKELLTHEFLIKRGNDEEEVIVDPPLIKRTIAENEVQAVSNVNPGWSIPPTQNAVQQQPQQQATKSDTPSEKNPSGAPSSKAEDDQGSADGDESDRFDEMPDSEVNIKKVKVLMGRGQELQEDEAPLADSSAKSVEGSTHSRNSSVDRLQDQGAPVLKNGVHPPQSGSKNKANAVPTVQVAQPDHYLVAAAVIENEAAQTYTDEMLKLVVTLPVEGQTQNVQFDFHLVEDDPVQVGKEMVAELGIPPGAVLEISETISGLACAARMQRDKHKAARAQQAGQGQVVPQQSGQGQMVPQQSGQGQLAPQSGQGQVVPQQQQQRPMQDLQPGLSMQQQSGPPMSQAQMGGGPQDLQPGMAMPQQGTQLPDQRQMQQPQQQQQQQQMIAPQQQQQQMAQHVGATPTNQIPSDVQSQPPPYAHMQQTQNHPHHQMPGQIPNQPMNQQNHLISDAQQQPPHFGYDQSANTQQPQLHQQPLNHQHGNPSPLDSQSLPPYGYDANRSQMAPDNVSLPPKSAPYAYDTGQAQNQGQQQAMPPQHMLQQGSLPANAQNQAPPYHYEAQQQQQQHHQGQMNQPVQQSNLHAAQQQPNQVSQQQQPSMPTNGQQQAHFQGTPQNITMQQQLGTNGHPQSAPMQSQTSHLSTQQPNNGHPQPAPIQAQASQGGHSHPAPIQSQLGHGTSLGQVQSMAQVPVQGIPTQGQSMQQPQQGQSMQQPQQGQNIQQPQQGQSMQQPQQGQSMQQPQQSQGMQQSQQGVPVQHQQQRHQPPQQIAYPSSPLQQHAQQKNVRATPEVSYQHGVSMPNANAQLAGMPSASVMKRSVSTNSHSTPQGLNQHLQQQVPYAGHSVNHANPAQQQLDPRLPPSRHNSGNAAAQGMANRNGPGQHPMNDESSISSQAMQSDVGKGEVLASVLDGTSVAAVSDDDDEELRKLDEDFHKNLQRAKKVFDNRMDNLQRSQIEREAQHKKTLEKHHKERVEFEKRLQQEEKEQNRRIEQLQREWDRRREVLNKTKRKVSEEEGTLSAEASLSSSPDTGFVMPVSRTTEQATAEHQSLNQTMSNDAASDR
ncbi:Probable serine/threonine-protein kinase WNK5 [Seminavis robusta]|uniref:non-specific serine/threonine protein kinase n=1 Tax=Seminavis robusta TaxID=568900 RepID=A0A9N8HFJ4_9STRA|nr:Probable serine/threonine-protein kinase WNK5 [Seminavis robusta]|eukprot:Sro352_g124280.1 Probable serine/threonine-protein kinase WNK5 (1530) ;mRNA; f:46067-50656